MANKNPKPIPREKSLATQFKPGQINNPSGTTKAFQAALPLRSLSYAQFMQLMHTVTNMTTVELDGWKRDDARLSIEKAFAEAALQAAAGNLAALSVLVDRMFGKPKDVALELSKVPTQLLVSELKRRMDADRGEIVI